MGHVAPPLAELTARAQTLTSAGDLVAARNVLARVLDPSDTDPLLASPDLATAAALHARILIALGEPHAARMWAGFAHAAEERLHGPDDERTIAAAATHAAVLARIGNHGQAAEIYHDVVQQLTVRDGRDSTRVLAAEADLATAEHAAGHCSAARSRLVQAWTRHRQVYGDAEANGIKMLARLGAMERECGALIESREHLGLAQELCARYLPADHPLVRQVAALASAAVSGKHVCGRVQQSTGPDADPPRQWEWPRRYGEPPRGHLTDDDAERPSRVRQPDIEPPDLVGSPRHRSPAPGVTAMNQTPGVQSVPTTPSRRYRPSAAPATPLSDSPPPAWMGTDIGGPEANVAGPEADMAGPEANVAGPEADMAGPEADRARPEADRAWPEADMAGPEGDRARPEADPGGADADMPEPDNRITDPKGSVYQQPLYLNEVHQAPGELTGRHARADTPLPVPGRRRPEYTADGRQISIGSAPVDAGHEGVRIDRRLPVPVLRPDPSSGRQPFILAGVVVAGIAVAAAVVAATLPRGEDATPPRSVGSPTAATTPSAPAATSAGPAAPAGVRLRDNRDSVTLTWRYPKGSEGPVLISGGRKGEPQRAFQQLPARSADYVVYGLSEQLNYCFTVAVVHSADRVAASPVVCTTR